jgi:hypothetical protein
MPFMELTSMEHDDEDKEDMAASFNDKPDYPYGLRISLTLRDLEKLGLDHKYAFVGGVFHGHFLACIRSIHENGVEAQIEHLAIESEDEEDEEYDEGTPV